MPRRWADEDSDVERLPDGMTRIGYDADTQVYSFRGADGSIYEGPAGGRYGPMTLVSGPNDDAPTYSFDDYDLDDSSSPSAARPFLSKRGGRFPQLSWRAEMMPLLNFFLLVAVVLMVLVYALSRGGGGGSAMDDKKKARDCAGQEGYVVSKGDTCWAMANGRGVSVGELVDANEGIDCDKLLLGEVVCLPVAKGGKEEKDGA
jgi:hypothetical protein